MTEAAGSSTADNCVGQRVNCKQMTSQFKKKKNVLFNSVIINNY